MADIDKLIKVFKGLDYCSNSSEKCGSDCPYFANAVCCIDEMQRDALEMMKELHRLLVAKKAILKYLCYEDEDDCGRRSND